MSPSQSLFGTFNNHLNYIKQLKLLDLHKPNFKKNEESCLPYWPWPVWPFVIDWVNTAEIVAGRIVLL